MFRRLATITGTAAALVAFIAPATASAGVLQAAADACPTLGPVGQYFSKYGDNANYQLLPGGAFDSGAQWSLEHAQVNDNALAFDRGGSATSPEFCATVDHPTLRFFARGDGDVGKVELLWTDDAGVERTKGVGMFMAGRSWAPAAPMQLSSVLGLVAGDIVAVRLRITAVTSDLQVDDVYVDPARAR
jgi:hypothetical protein